MNDFNPSFIKTSFMFNKKDMIDNAPCVLEKDIYSWLVQ